MTTKIKEFIAAKKLPNWLARHKVLLSFDKVDKVFPKLGLPNCQENAVISNISKVCEAATLLVDQLNYNLQDVTRQLEQYPSNFPGKKISTKKAEQMKYFAVVARDLSNSLLPSQVIQVSNEKISLKIPRNILDSDKTVVFKQGQSLFKVYNSIHSSLAKLRCWINIEKLETMPEFKRFSSDNLPSKSFQVVFSSDGIDGLWDIATMSMRGIATCQSWDGQYKNALVGSIVDPFVGVIYLTTGTHFTIGKQDYGTKMIKRSLVRMVVNSKTKKPLIVIDRMYPDLDNGVLTKFISLIKDRVGEKFDVVYGPNIHYNNIQHFYIPSSSAIKKLTPATKSYRDTKIMFKADFIEAPIIDIQMSSNAAFRNILRDAAYYTVSNRKLSSIGFKGETKKRIKKLIQHNHFPTTVKNEYLLVADRVIAAMPKPSPTLTSKEYMRQLLHYYMSANIPLTPFVKFVNSYYKTKLTSKTLYKLLEPVQEEIGRKIKDELKSLVEKKPVVLNLPN